MNATRPEAALEDSTPIRGSAGLGAWGPAALAALAAVVLLAAEFTPVIAVRTVSAHPRTVRTIQAGPHHAWALVPIAVLGLLLAGAWSRRGGTAPLAGLALLGLAALGVAVGVDLPDARATGVVGTLGHLTAAHARAGAGLYLETLGAVGLLVAAAAGALLGPRRRGVPRRARRPAAGAESTR